MRRSIVLVTAVMLLSLAGVGWAEAKTVDVTLKRGKSTSMLVKQPLKTPGEWVVKLDASSDGEKNVLLKARRTGGSSFTVLDTTGADNTCEGAAGHIYCEDITVPAVPAPGTWTFTATSRGTRPTHVRLTITWRAVPSAG